MGGHELCLPTRTEGISYESCILIPFEFAHLSESCSNAWRAFNEWQSASGTFKKLLILILQK